MLMFSVQNQFFITLSRSSQVSNEIGEALYQRVMKANKFVPSLGLELKNMG